MHLNFKRTRTNNDYTIFSNLRKQCKYRSKLDYDKYLNNVQNSINVNSKFFEVSLNQKPLITRYPKICFQMTLVLVMGKK